MNLPDKIIHEKWDEIDKKSIPGPLKEPDELLCLMRRYRYAHGLRFDRDLDLNYLPRRINLARLKYSISPPGRDTYHLYPNDLRQVEGPWRQPLPFSLPHLVILDICFKEATYWLPSILQAVTPALKRIILRDGDDVIDSVRVFDFPFRELNEFLYQHLETRLILPFVGSDERAIWIGELFFAFQRGHVKFFSRNDFLSGFDYEPELDPFDRGEFLLEV